MATDNNIGLQAPNLGQNDWRDMLQYRMAEKPVEPVVAPNNNTEEIQKAQADMLSNKEYLDK